MWSWLLPADISNVWLFVALGSVSAMLFSMAKTGFGGSVGMLATPIMIFACGDNAATALGVMLPMLIIADYVAVASWWRQWNLKQVLMLLPGALAGVGAAWAMLKVLGAADRSAGDAYLKIGVGVIALAFVTLQVLRSLRGRSPAFRPVLWQGTAAGATAGLTSTLAHAAGPIVAMYLLPQQMSKDRYVATTALFFWVANQVKLAPYLEQGMINLRTFGACLLFVPGIILGSILAGALNRRINQRWFNGVVYALLAVAGAQLVIEALHKLWR